MTDRAASSDRVIHRVLLSLTLLLSIPFDTLTARNFQGAVLKLSTAEKRERIAQLDEVSREFLHFASPIMPAAELDAFLLLETEADRQEKIDEFWSTWAGSETVGEWLADYKTRFEEAPRFFDDRLNDRAQIYLLRGRPSMMNPVPCPDYFRLMEVWSYESLPGLGDDAVLVFYKPSPADDFVLLAPVKEGKRPFEEKLLSETGARIGSVPIILGIPDDPSDEPTPLALACPAGQELLAGITLAKKSPNRIALLLDRSFHPRSKESSEQRLGFRTTGGVQVPLQASISYPGKRGGRTAARIRLKIDPTGLAMTTRNDRKLHAVQVRGEVRDHTRVVDSFRYDYEIPFHDHDPIGLVIERFLPPYDYELTIHLTDQSSEAEGLLVTTIEVPYIEPIRREGLGEQRSALVAEIGQDFRRGESSIRLLPLGDGFATGRQRFETLLTGNEIESVEFYVDDRKMMAKREPPYTLELGLGDIPTQATIRVVGRDGEGRIIAGDEMLVNGGSNPFRVRIVSPRISENLSGETRVEVVASVPAEYELKTIELYLEDQRIAIGYESPLIQTIHIPSSSKTTYLRAVATIDDELESKVEDVVLLNAPELLEQIDVRLVELPTSVTRKGDVVADLPVEAFQVYDEGKRVAIDKFDYVRDLPLSLGLAIDSSGSMRPRMTEALKTGARFFQRVMKPGDRAFLLAFNDEPKLIQRWTDSLTNLTAGLASLDAEEMTALYDAVIHSLYNFQGLRGQKALIVLSDGQDTASRFSFDQTLEYARRTAIPIYTIGIGIRRNDVETRSRLKRLAKETGAESYFIEMAGDLRDIYDKIELELRSQYILGFYPSREALESGSWRRIEVKVDGGSGRTVRGYYP